MRKNFWEQLDRPTLALAPMAGITDSAFRAICKQYGADVTYSEMAAASALYFNPKKTLELIRFSEEERPYVVQLFGKDPKHFAKAAEIISSLTPRVETRHAASRKARPDGIDINFGCPAKKVFGHGSGCALMPQKELAREIIKSVCDNTDLPVSIKIRAGIKDMDAMEFLENTAELPYSAVMIHARTYEGGFSGPLDFELVSEIKKKFPEKIILANGGINTPQDAKNILEKYPDIDGLGIARGAWGKPFLFQQIKDIVTKGKYKDYSFSEIKKIMLSHAELIFKDKEVSGKFEIRKHLLWYVRGFPGAAEIRKKLVVAENVKEIEEILYKTFS